MNSFFIIVKAIFAKYNDYTLAIDLDTKEHDTVIFTRKSPDGGRGKPTYAHIHYNPNINEELAVASYFIKRMSKKYLHQGYRLRDGNLNAECSILTCTEVFKFMRLKFDPFTDLRNTLWEPDKKNHRLKYTYLEDLICDDTIDTN